MFGKGRSGKEVFNDTQVQDLVTDGYTNPWLWVALSGENTIGQVLDGKVGVLGHWNKGHADEHRAAEWDYDIVTEALCAEGVRGRQGPKQDFSFNKVPTVFP